MCKRNTADPLVRTLLDKYGLNLLSIPRKNVACGDLYIGEASGLSAAGQLSQVLTPVPVLPEQKAGERLADVSGLASGQISTAVGLDVSEGLLAAFVGAGVLVSLKQAYTVAKAARIRFQFRDATRDYIEPLTLGASLKNCHLDTTNPFIREDQRYFVVGGVVRAQSISIVAEDIRDRGVDVDIGAMHLADVTAKVNAKRTGVGEVTYAGPERLAIGVELYEIVADREQQKVALKAATKEPRVLRESPARAVEPAFIGGREGDIFITLT